MWTRAELKEQAKEALHRNYWRIVLVASLLFFLGCGSGGYQLYRSAHNGGANNNANEVNVEEAGQEQGMDEMQGLPEVEGAPNTEEPEPEYYEVSFMEYVVVGAIASAVVALAIFFSLSAVIVAADIFLVNPFSVGGSRFMIKSVEDTAQVKEITYGFDHSYKNIVKVLFLKEIFVFLWALVFVIPGIVKMYQYYMVPYILAEHPDMEYREVLQTSRDMMEGNKWNTFVLGLSFILWDFFGAVTFGIGEVLYVQPYRQLTFAALYCELKNNGRNNRKETQSLEGGNGI